MSPTAFAARIAKVVGADTDRGWCLSSPDGQIVSDEDIARAEEAGLVTVDRHRFTVGPVAFLTEAGIASLAKPGARS